MRSEDTVFRATVVRRETVTPRMLRLTFADIAGTAGEKFEGSVLPDDFFSLYIPHGEGHAARYYTVRAWRPEPGEMDVDVVLHDAGPATTWAAGVQIGADAHFDAPRGHYVVPAGAPRAIVAGDATALPAIGRIFDDRASEVPVLAIVAVEHEDDRQDLALRDGDEVRWVTPAELVSHTLAAADDAAAGTYLWFSGEAADMRAVRKHVRHALRWPNERFMTMGYWRRDAEKWAARFEQQAGLQEQLEAIWESGEDSEEQRDRSDALLERHGL